jgi:hypothetical protein
MRFDKYGIGFVLGDGTWGLSGLSTKMSKFDATEADEDTDVTA